MHIKSLHQEKGILDKNFYPVEETTIGCKICSSDVQATEGSVRSHMNRLHSTTLEIYAQKYIYGKEEPCFNEDLKAPSNIAWYDRCAIRCRLCKEIMWNSSLWSKHAKKCSKATEGQRPDKEMAKSNVHECRICNHKVLHNRESLSNHIEKRHGMSLSDYTVKFRPYDEETQGNVLAEEKSLVRPWFDGCRYKCLLCPSYVSKAKNPVIQHLKNTHKEKAVLDVNFRVLEEQKYNCLSCGNSMFKNEGAIRIHLRKCLDITLEEYAAKFIEVKVRENPIIIPHLARTVLASFIFRISADYS